MKAANRNKLCPICEKNPVTPEYQPFCSARCAEVDLGRWLKGNYVIPGEKTDVPETAPDEAS